MFKKTLLLTAACLASVSAEARYQTDPTEHEKGALRALSGLEAPIVKTATGSEIIYSAFDVNNAAAMLNGTEWLPDFPYDSKEQWKADYGYAPEKVINAIYQCQMKPGTQYVEGTKPGTEKKAIYLKNHVMSLNLAVCYQVADWD